MPPADAFAALLNRLGEAAPDVLARALERGGHYADVFAEYTVRHRLVWRQAMTGPRLGAPQRQVRRRVVEGAAVQVLGAGPDGFAPTQATDADALLTCAAQAAAQPGSALPPMPVPPLEVVRGPALPGDAPDRIRPSEKEALLRAAADAAFALDARVQSVQVAYQDQVRRTAVATSEGVLAVQASALVGLRVAVTLAAGGGMVTAYAVAGGPGGFGHFFAARPEDVACEAVERARRRAAAQPVEPGAGPVVLAAGWSGVWLHEAVGHLLEADVLDGSPLAGRLGTGVAIPDVTLVDDPTHPGGRATYAFDDEGVAATRTTLIDGGVLRAALTDRRHAGGMPSTGNGRRQDYRHRPLPRMSNLLLLGGSASPGDLLAGVQNGLYVAAVGPGVVRPGIGFAVDVLDGFRIEQGRLGAPVAGLRLLGTGPGMLAALDGIGTDFRLDRARGLCEKQGQVVPVSVGMPAVRVRAMQAVPVDAEGRGEEPR